MEGNALGRDISFEALPCCAECAGVATFRVCRNWIEVVYLCGVHAALLATAEGVEIRLDAPKVPGKGG